MPHESGATAATAATATPRRTGCVVPTKRGTACPHPLVRAGLCALHDPDGTYAGQHMGYREKLLRRPEVQAALPGPPVQARPPAPLSRSTGLTGQGTARAQARPEQQRASHTGRQVAAYLAELEYAASRLARVLDDTPLDGDAVSVAVWKIARLRAQEALTEARAMRPRA